MLVFCLALLGAAAVDQAPFRTDITYPAGHCHGAASYCATVSSGECGQQKGCWRKQTCALRDEDFCAFNASRASCEAVGCAWGAGCTGIPDECSTFPLAQCVYHAGCSVDPETHTCTGHPPDCETHREMIACGQAHGCFWGNHCGVAVPASRCVGAMTPWQCGDLEGCSWTHACAGHPLPCDAFIEAMDCSAQAGCFWVEPPIPESQPVPQSKPSPQKRARRK